MIEQLIPQEFCLKCSGCCRFAKENSQWNPVLLKEESERGLKITLKPLPQKDTLVCQYFTPEDNRCRIYASRPFECQLYPFLINRKETEVFLAVDLKCPFVQKDRQTQKFKGHVRYLIALLQSAQYREILSKNPQIIQAYPEVLNLGRLSV